MFQSIKLFIFIIFCAHNILSAQSSTPSVKNEKHLKNIKRLTFGGNNAEAYWSFNGKYLSFQSDNQIGRAHV